MATVNNNWPTPVATDLVKDGWEAIKDLGDAIDTTLGVYSAAGFSKISTNTFSAVSSFSLPNSTFTSSYVNYRLIFNFIGSATSNLRMRMRASGTDETGNSYYWVYTGQRDTGGNYQYNGSPETSAFIHNLSTQTRQHLAFDIFKPQVAEETSLTGKGVGSDATSALFMNSTMFLATSTAYDSATFYPGSGTMTGTCYVYGYKA